MRWLIMEILGMGVGFSRIAGVVLGAANAAKRGPTPLLALIHYGMGLAKMVVILVSDFPG